MAQDENSKNCCETGARSRGFTHDPGCRNSKTTYIEYDPFTEAVCGICMRVFPLYSNHVCIKQGQTTDVAGHVLGSDKPTLRDQFASAAVAGIIQKSWPSSQEAIDDDAGLAYRIADAMMAARKNPPK